MWQRIPPRTGQAILHDLLALLPTGDHGRRLAGHAPERRRQFPRHPAPSPSNAAPDPTPPPHPARSDSVPDASGTGDHARGDESAALRSDGLQERCHAGRDYMLPRTERGEWAAVGCQELGGEGLVSEEVADVDGRQRGGMREGEGRGCWAI